MLYDTDAAQAVVQQRTQDSKLPSMPSSSIPALTTSSPSTSTLSGRRKERRQEPKLRLMRSVPSSSVAGSLSDSRHDNDAKALQDACVVVRHGNKTKRAREWQHTYA